MTKLDYSTYLSPFTWRYGSDEMRRIWSEENKRLLWRKIWVALAKAQKKYGLISQKEIDDLVKNQENIDIEKALEIEKQVYHDLMSEVKVYASQSKIGGGKIHLGATSMDIEDNADAIRIKESLEVVEEKLVELLKIFSAKIEEYKDLPCMGYTHLQPAEPTTVGYRMAFYAQDLMMDYQLLVFLKTILKGKGMKGAVGTAASYTKLVGEKEAVIIEEEVMRNLSMDAVMIANQTSPRKIEYLVSSLLSSIAQSVHKFAFDVRIMQSPNFGEWQEPSGSKDIGSSAMPFKKNPQRSEQVCSLSRLIISLSDVFAQNAANMLLERTLDDSANRRAALPEIFLATDQVLTVTTKVASGLNINQKQIEKNLDKFGPFAASEGVLMEAVKKGGNRQDLHEVLREVAMKAWTEVMEGNTNPMEQLLNDNPEIKKYIDQRELSKLMDIRHHIGNAPKKSQELVEKIKKLLVN